MPPRHEHQCLSCSQVYEAQTGDPVPCPSCGSAHTEWHPQIAVGNFATFWHPHLGHEPVLIESARQMDHELKKANAHCPEGRTKEKFRHLPQTKEEAQHHG